MNKSEKIERIYCETHSIKKTAKICEVSWHRVVKILSTKGYILNDNHRAIMRLHNLGLSYVEIANTLGLSIGTVRAYLPAVRPFYFENRSANAMKIAAWRERKEAGRTDEA